MTEYTSIRTYTNEKARFEGKDLASSIVSYVRSLWIAARCVVLRGIEGAYENGEALNGTIVEVSYHMPLVIDVLLPAAESGPVIAVLETMVTDGLVSVSTATVTSFRSPHSLILPHLLVRDIRTANPIAAHADFTVRIAMELLIDHALKSLPIIDAQGKVIGILTQGDLVMMAAMPVRIGLLSSVPEIERKRWLQSTEGMRVPEIMTGAPQTIRDDAKVTSAVHFIAKRGLKRFPVVDAQGKLTGMLSRIDVLKALA
jgi:CBS domain-containing protein